MGKQLTVQLNKEEAEALFNENSILFGKFNGITENKALELLGEIACNYVFSHVQDKGATIWWNAWYLDSNNYCKYMYHDGFLQAVTMHNVELELRGDIDDSNERKPDKSKHISRKGKEV